VRLLQTSKEYAVELVELVEVPWCPLGEIPIWNNEPSSWHYIHLKGDKWSLLFLHMYGTFDLHKSLLLSNVC